MFLILEPFYGGSHKALIDSLMINLVDLQPILIKLPAKKWHWRARCGVLMLYTQIPKVNSDGILFCSSVLNLAELLGIRPDLQKLRKIVYFHENQLVYPVRDIKERDIQYAYNQITASLAADFVLFNSEFNRSSFLDNIQKVVKMFPDQRPKDIKSQLVSKCKVVYFPVEFPQELEFSLNGNQGDILHILWPHRWEHDKGPEVFFNILFKLKKENCAFKLSVLGENFNDNPEIFSTAQKTLKDEILHFGFVESKSEYYQILSTSHIVVSTAKHEFFGVSIIESVFCGCFPLLPNSLVYPELYPMDCLYLSTEDLYSRLKFFCLNPSTAIDARKKLSMDFNAYSSSTFIKNILQFIENK